MGFPPGRIIGDDPLGMRCAAAAVCGSAIPFLAAGVVIFILVCVKRLARLVSRATRVWDCAM